MEHDRHCQRGAAREPDDRTGDPLDAARNTRIMRRIASGQKT